MRISIAATAVLLVITPTAALACCMAVAAHAVWPWDGLEEIPVDAAVILYGSTYELPLEEWSVNLVPESGEPVSLATSLSMMTDDYFLIVAKPEEALALDTEYTCTFTRNGVDIEGAKEFSFKTAASDADWASPPTPDLSYEGLGVPMKDADGGWCVSSVTEEAGALALTISGEGLGNRAILLQARDSQETKVFDTVLSGEWDLDRQLTLGGGLCSAHFEVNPCEHYCVRAAALDHRGDPGPWSEWSCSDEIGDWVCGDPGGSVLFGDDIEEGKALPQDVQSCLEGGTWEPEADTIDEGESGLPESDSYSTDEDSETGCAMGASRPAAPWGLLVFGLLVALLFRVGRRRSPSGVSLALALALFMGGAAGCEEGSSGGADAVEGDTLTVGEDAAVDSAEGVQDDDVMKEGPSDKGDTTPAVATVGCHPPTKEDLAPGEPVASLDTAGAGACSGKTVGDVIGQIHADHPELLDIQTIYTADEWLGDGSFFYPFLRADGGFSVALKRGLGDCPAGCTDNYYFYFATDDSCYALDVGHYHGGWSAEGDCVEKDGLPLWGYPPPSDPLHECGADNSPQQISGTYEMLATGIWEPCAEKGGQFEPINIETVVTVEVSQDPANPAVGTVAVEGTGHPLIDGQSFPAEFVRQRFRASEEYSNLPSECPQEHSLAVEYDFECFQTGQLNVTVFGSEDCSFCKGYMHLSLDHVMDGKF